MSKRDVVTIDKDNLDEILTLKEKGFSNVKPSSESGYLIARTNTQALHNLTKKHRLMSEEEYRALLISIAEVGQLEPVKIYRGKIVDGRHRYWALKDLGIDYIKYIEIPHNTTLSEVKDMVMGSEVRRADSPFQKAAKAYLEYSTQDEYDMRYIANKIGISHGSISKMKTIAEKLGSDIIKHIYNKGYCYINKKKFTSLSSLYKYALTIDHEDKEPSEDTYVNKIPEELADYLKSLKKEGHLTVLAAVKQYVTNAINDLNND